MVRPRSFLSKDSVGFDAKNPFQPRTPNNEFVGDVKKKSGYLVDLSAVPS